jgi:hypothetical protein
MNPSRDMELGARQRRRWALVIGHAKSKLLRELEKGGHLHFIIYVHVQEMAAWKFGEILNFY